MDSLNDRGRNAQRCITAPAARSPVFSKHQDTWFLFKKASDCVLAEFPFLRNFGDRVMQLNKAICRTRTH